MRAFSVVKRGRPRQESGRDEGTPELRSRKQALAAGSDPRLSESPLGILLSRALITASQHEAGEFYARLYRYAASGPVHLSSGRHYETLGGAPRRYGRAAANDNEADERNEERFSAARAALAKAGRLSRDLVETVAVYESWPIHACSTGQPLGAAQLSLLRAGLDAILEWRMMRHRRQHFLVEKVRAV
ncbi:MAG TPA: hypothetical protein VHL08_04645 [Dongiaceae bacterium]|nr:hypothetical protein [Dongiaceae bacterium]